METNIPLDYKIIDHPKAIYKPSNWTQIKYNDITAFTNISLIENYTGDASMIYLKYRRMYDGSISMNINLNE